ncbi:unnamed protein product [Blepharisma stoltei]|uniref:HTH CENPB-type domain-containing protein n=1 Tax=Blepharisma stoltei TaxID=1481888 RepID=A0AAU9K7K9_9CILI|nr:unnamed protein product [Blepharisma stoltei]
MQKSKSSEHHPLCVVEKLSPDKLPSNKRNKAASPPREQNEEKTLSSNGNSKPKIKRKDFTKDYGAGDSSVCNIIKQAEKIKNYLCKSFDQKGPWKPKKKQKNQNPHLDKALLIWINQWRSIGLPISDSLMMEKAKELQNKIEALTGDQSSFSGSYGWLTEFKSRYGIKNVDTCGDQLSASIKEIPSFIKELNRVIIEENYSAEQIYNCDETSLFWKILPSKSAQILNETHDYKILKSRVSILLCCNTAGTHRLPLFITENQKCSETNGKMTNFKFKNWLKNTFIPAIATHLQSINLPTKALLLLENSKIHTLLTSEKENENLKILYFPNNTTLLLQPMSQSIISSFKRNYKENFLKQLFKYYKDNKKDKKSIIQFLSSYDINQCNINLSEGWNCIPETTIKSAWRKLGINPEAIPENNENSIHELKIDAKKVLELEESELQEYLEQENNANSIRDLLNDDDIIEQVISEEEEDEYDKIDRRSALKGFQIIIRYLEQECFKANDVKYVRRLMQRTEKKPSNGLKKLKVQEWYENGENQIN